MRPTDIVHRTQMISLLGQRMDKDWGDEDFYSLSAYAELLRELESELEVTLALLKDELYPVEQTVDGQLREQATHFEGDGREDGRWNWYGFDIEEYPY